MWQPALGALSCGPEVPRTGCHPVACSNDNVPRGAATREHVLVRRLSSPAAGSLYARAHGHFSP